MRRSRTAAVVLVLFAAGVTGSVGWTAAKSARRIQTAVLHAGENPLAVRSRAFGLGYARAVEEIRDAIPADGAYALVDGDPVELGGAFWVRFDLAPRKALFLGLRQDLPTAGEIAGRLPPTVHWVVVGNSQAPPRLIAVDRFLAQLGRERR